MKNKKERIELSYNYNSQITVDHDSGIILANDVTQECTDHNQLQSQIELTEENLGGLPEGTKVSMDNGYFSGPNLRYLKQKGWMAISRTGKVAVPDKIGGLIANSASEIGNFFGFRAMLNSKYHY